MDGIVLTYLIMIQETSTVHLESTYKFEKKIKTMNNSKTINENGENELSFESR